MPYPSAGCRTCKTRRIKCDGAQPKCQRCIKSRRSCVYSDLQIAGFSIHKENKYASGLVKRPRGPRSIWREESSNQKDEALSVHRPLFDLQTRAVVLYLYHQLQAPADFSSLRPDGLSDCVYQWGTKMGQSPMIGLAISCMALATYSQTQQYPAAAMEASTKYAQLLQVVQTTVPAVNETNIDACLLVIFLMGRYENAMHQRGSAVSRTTRESALASFSHHDGAMAILRIWKSSMNHNSWPISRIIKYSRRGLLRSALLRKRALPTWIMNGSHFGEHGLELKYDRLVVRLANLRPEVSSLCQRSSSVQNPKGLKDLLLQAQRLNIEARDIGDAMHAWTSYIPQDWCHQLHYLSGGSHLYPREHFYSACVYIFPSSDCAATWILYFAMRLLLCSTRLKIIGILLGYSLTAEIHSLEKQRVETLESLTFFANALASTVPFCLQMIRVEQNSQMNASSLDSKSSVKVHSDREIAPWSASLPIWPLSIASSLKDGLDTHQKQWFRSELACLGKITGQGFFSDAELPEWSDLE